MASNEDCAEEVLNIVNKEYNHYLETNKLTLDNDDDHDNYMEDFLNNWNIDEKYIDILYTWSQQQKLNDADKKNEKWKNMNLSDWIACENHPCPIITISSNPINSRINNYIKTSLDNNNKYKFNINFWSKAKCIDCKSGKGEMEFQIFKIIILNSLHQK